MMPKTIELMDEVLGITQQSVTLWNEKLVVVLLYIQGHVGLNFYREC